MDAVTAPVSIGAKVDTVVCTLRKLAGSHVASGDVGGNLEKLGNVGRRDRGVLDPGWGTSNGARKGGGSEAQGQAKGDLGVLHLD